MPDQPHPSYPSAQDIDNWISSVFTLADTGPVPALPLPELTPFTQSYGIRHMDGACYIRFEPRDRAAFHAYWQPAQRTPAPLLVHVPGYGAEISAHPDLVACGYNILHVSPLGYTSPQGQNLSLQRDGMWPVLPDTIRSGGVDGYRPWLADCIAASRWALERDGVIPERMSFFGSSQGGGTALLLGSLFRDRGVRCVAADVPFLTNFPLAASQGAYVLARDAIAAADNPDAAWRAAGLVDTLSHAHRLTCPVLLTAAGLDTTCPPGTIESLFRNLPATRALLHLHGVGHRYTTEFIPLARAWFSLYA